jgi:hypothetical protein
VLLVRSAAAQADVGAPGQAMQVHGFVSQGFIISTRNNYLAKSKGGSVEFSEVGINFTQQLLPDLRVGVQLFSRDLGPLGNYDVKADWFYLDYRVADWLGFRAGRIKLPFGLYNEINDVDSARVPILLPQSVYPTENRDYLLAQTGGELYGRLGAGQAGALDYRLYGGTILLETVQRPGSPVLFLDLGVPYVFGGRLLWEAPLDGLRVGGSVQALRLDTRLLLNSTTQVDVEIPLLLWIGSLEYAFSDLQLAAEYSRWHVRSESSDPMLFPNAEVTQERAYALAALRLTEWLQPAVYYSLWFPDTRDRQGREAQQHDFSGTLRFDINQHWLFKLEGHYMIGTAGVSSALNEDRPIAQLTRRWVAVLAKTTAYF